MSHRLATRLHAHIFICPGSQFFEVLRLERTMKQQLLLPLAVLTALAIPGRALAHSVETNYLQLDKMLEFETVFSTGEPLQAASVKIYAPGNSNEPWFEGETDEDGKFAFEPDSSMPGEWEVFIKEKGHADILTVPVTETGVDVEQISDLPGVHMHYLAAPLGFIGMVIGGSRFAWSRRRKSIS